MKDLFDTLTQLQSVRPSGREARNGYKESLAGFALEEALGVDDTTRFAKGDWLDLDHAMAARSQKSSVMDEFDYEEDWRGESDAQREKSYDEEE